MLLKICREPAPGLPWALYAKANSTAVFFLRHCLVNILLLPLNFYVGTSALASNCLVLNIDGKIREFFVDVLSSWITSGKYTRHEFNELVQPAMESEIQIASHDPATLALDIAHALAFRSGLGSSLFASHHSSFTAEDIKLFASFVFTRDNIAVLGTGISQQTLSELVSKSLGGNLSTASSQTATPSKYYGGETRTAGQGGPETVFIGFGSAGAPIADIAVLAAHLSPEPSVKWSKGASALAQALPEGASVQSVYLPYSDASLFGLLIQGKTSAQVTEAGKAVVSALKSAVASGGVKGDDLKKAISKAKFTAASAAESRQSLVSVLGPKVCQYHLPFPTNDVLLRLLLVRKPL